MRRSASTSTPCSSPAESSDTHKHAIPNRSRRCLCQRLARESRPESRLAEMDDPPVRVSHGRANIGR
jgi:hypothetical protein